MPAQSNLFDMLEFNLKSMSQHFVIQQRPIVLTETEKRCFVNVDISPRETSKAHSRVNEQASS